MITGRAAAYIWRVGAIPPPDRLASFYDPGYGYLVCMSQYTRTIISALLVEEAYPIVSATLSLLYSCTEIIISLRCTIKLLNFVVYFVS